MSTPQNKTYTDYEGITGIRLLNKTTTIKWNEIRSFGLSWQIKGHSADICWQIVSDNGKKSNLQPSFYSRENLHLIAESLIEKSPGAIFDTWIRKIADGKFPWYLF